MKNAITVTMTNTFTVLVDLHARIITGDDNAINTYSRMQRLFKMYTAMCAEVAKSDEALARVYFQMGEFMLKEAHTSLDLTV